MTKQLGLAAAGAIFLLLSLGAALAYGAIGQEVTADGTLLEPFYLIPLSLLAASIGIVLLAVSGVVTLSARVRSSHA